MIYIAKQADAHYLGSCLSSPENIVRLGEGLGGVVVEAGGDRDGGGRHDGREVMGD